MPSVEFFTADSFTDTRFAGNPAGVVFHNGELSPAEMQTIAGELHLETAFLSPPQSPDADYTVAYYTGTARIPFCGHDTIAAAAVLAYSGRLTLPGTVCFATDAGNIVATVSRNGDVTLTLALPQLGEVVDTEPFLQALDIDPSSLHPSPAQIASVGTPFILLGVTDEATLHSLRPDMAKLTALQTAPGAPDGLYVWTPNVSANNDVAFHSRCFCPGVDLPEDPVTGSATGAFAGYVVHHGLLPNGDGKQTFRTEQGRAMGRTGHVTVSMECAGNAVTRLQITGRAVVVSQGTLFL